MLDTSGLYLITQMRIDLISSHHRVIIVTLTRKRVEQVYCIDYTTNIGEEVN